LIDPSEPPTFGPDDQIALLPDYLVTRGWAELSADEQAGITRRVDGGEFGDCAPRAGWPSQSETLAAIQVAAETPTPSRRRTRHHSKQQQQRSHSLPAAQLVLMAPPPPRPPVTEQRKRPAGPPSTPQRVKKTPESVSVAGPVESRPVEVLPFYPDLTRDHLAATLSIAELQTALSKRETLFAEMSAERDTLLDKQTSQIAKIRKVREEQEALIAEQTALLTSLQAELNLLKIDGDALGRADRLGVEISNLRGDAPKLEAFRKFYDAIGRRRPATRSLLRAIVDNHMTEEVVHSELDQVIATLDVELILLKKALRERYEAWRSKNGGKGVECYVREDGLLEPLDLEADLELKRRSAKNLMSFLSALITSPSWRRDLKSAELAVAKKEPYYQKRTKTFLSGVELEAFVSSRREANARELCLLADIIVNMSMNGARELHTQLLLYLSLSRHNHGQAQISMAHDSTFGLSSSYGTSYHLSHYLSKRYLESFPQRRLDMLERSPSRSRDPYFKLDPGVVTCRSGWNCFQSPIRRARVGPSCSSRCALERNGANSKHSRKHEPGRDER
jgi:hypothetical protein